jgi:hypothetical protein
LGCRDFFLILEVQVSLNDEESPPQSIAHLFRILFSPALFCDWQRLENGTGTIEEWCPKAVLGAVKGALSRAPTDGHWQGSIALAALRSAELRP